MFLSQLYIVHERRGCRGVLKLSTVETNGMQASEMLICPFNGTRQGFWNRQTPQISSFRLETFQVRGVSGFCRVPHLVCIPVRS
jgi:hypothetical protein